MRKYHLAIDIGASSGRHILGWIENGVMQTQNKDKDVKVGNIDRFEFYDRAKQAYAVIATGEEAVYANIVLKKGVIK